METFKTIEARKSVRRYLDKPVEDNSINKIVQAGTMAASSAKLHFTVITNHDVLAAVAEETKRRFLASGNNFLVQTASVAGFNALYRAPLLIVVSALKGASSKMLAANNIASAACAAQNMMLAATDLRLGSCYLYGPSLAFEQQAIRRMAGIAVEDEVLACVVFGHTDDTSPHTPRPPASNVRYCR